MTTDVPVSPVQPWQKNRLSPLAEPRLPEPAQLYSLITLTLRLHAAALTGLACRWCGEDWPCPDVRLAWRLREGF
ncbi:hypothetical protein [Amycolatopsis samaneae]|uniref:Uncharacterized protein n=1 Tax=Amycolatopsis samaneae TaxID=664691 RepID=A0ABW5GU09_9PSEU